MVNNSTKAAYVFLKAIWQNVSDVDDVDNLVIFYHTYQRDKDQIYYQRPRDRNSKEVVTSRIMTNQIIINIMMTIINYQIMITTITMMTIIIRRLGRRQKGQEKNGEEGHGLKQVRDDRRHVSPKIWQVGHENVNVRHEVSVNVNENSAVRIRLLAESTEGQEETVKD